MKILSAETKQKKKGFGLGSHTAAVRGILVNVGEKCGGRPTAEELALTGEWSVKTKKSKP